MRVTNSESEFTAYLSDSIFKDTARLIRSSHMAIDGHVCENSSNLKDKLEEYGFENVKDLENGTFTFTE